MIRTIRPTLPFPPHLHLLTLTPEIVKLSILERSIRDLGGSSLKVS